MKLLITRLEGQLLKAAPLPAKVNLISYAEEGEAGKYYCMDCKQSKACPGYNDRINHLTKPLYCYGCREDHPAILFSAKHRRLSPESGRKRICIGLEGRMMLCTHQGISWTELVHKDWAKEPGFDAEPKPGSHFPYGVEMECGHPDHLNVRMASAPLRPLSHISQYADRVAVRCNMEISMPRTGLDSHIEIRPVAVHVLEVLGAAESSAAMACPHLKTTPDRLGRFDLHRRSFGHGYFSYRCHTCTFVAAFNLADEAKAVASIKLTGGNTMRRSERPSGPRWIQHVDPDSYGHFTDPGTKHITWCDDRRCATTFELVRTACLYRLAWGRDRKQTWSERLDEMTAKEIYAIYHDPRHRMSWAPAM